MRGLIKFEVGESVTIDGRELKFDGLVPPIKARPDCADDLQFLDARNRRAVNFTPDEFLSIYAQGGVRLHRAAEKLGDVVGDDESPAESLMRRWRHFWTEAFDRSPVPKSTNKLQAFIQEQEANQPDPIKPPSPHTLRRWLRDRGMPGDRRSRQMGQRSRLKNARVPVHSFVQAAYEAAAHRYWSNYKVTFQDVQIEVRAAVFAENARRRRTCETALRVPGRTTLWRWLRQERTFDNIATRDGRFIAERLFKGIRDSLSAKRIMDVAIIDHKRMDVHVCDASRRFPIGRPWLAVLLDVKSRMVLGYSLSFEDPSVLSAMACVRAAMRGVPDIKQKFPRVEGEWESFGVPRTILADNAWENTGSSFLDACADNGISIEWAPVRRPEYKGILERFFSRLDDQLAHKLPGAVIDHSFALAQRRINPQADANLTLAELDELVCRYLIEVYSHDLHTTLRDTPLRVWREGVKRDGIELAHDLSGVEHAMGKLVRDRTLNHEGVRFQSLTYRSSSLDGLLADLLPLQEAGVRTGSARVKLKYHPEDMSRVFIWNEVRNTYVALFCTEESYSRGLSERVHAELQRVSRNSADSFIGEEERCLRKAELQRSIQEAYDRQPVKERRRRSRMLSGESSHSSHTDSKISIDGLSSRTGGDRPEKAAVRSHKAKKVSNSLPSAETGMTIKFDPFSDRNREVTIERSLQRLS